MLLHRFSTTSVIFILTTLFQPLAFSAENKHIFVDPINGSVKGTPGLNGSITTPFKTIKDAINYAEKEYNRGSTRFPYTIQLRGGTYEEVVTRSGMKGTAERPITIQAYQGESVTFDGTIDVTGGWQTEGGNIYSKHIGQDVWQLFINEDGKWQEKNNARWPNARFGEKQGDIASIYSRESWAHANESGNDFGLMQDDSLTDDVNINNVDLSGAVVVANVGSFDTWTRKITSHTAGSNSFEYGATPRIWKNQKHFYYFVEGKKELLDNDNEWFFDRASKTAYIYSSTGVPNQEIRVKARPYGFKVGGLQHVTVKNIDFFGTTLRCGNCENFTLENANLNFGGSSRRALGIVGEKSEILFISSNNRDLSHKANNTLRNITVRNVDGQGFLMRGNGSVVENSLFENFDWAASESYAPSSSLVLDGNFSIFRYNTVTTAGSSETLATSGASPGGSGKYTGPLGGQFTAEYNDISNSGFAQSDGAMIQVRIAAQKGTIIRYNWLHDSIKYGVRFDAPIPAKFYGSDAIAHHNVIWNANGMMVKGENQRVYHNTVFDTLEDKRSDLIILDDADIGGILGGANRGSSVINNAADAISSQRATIDPVLSWVDYGHNFNGHNEIYSLKSQLKDAANRDFRPAQASLLNLGDGITDSYLSNQQGGVLSYSGSYRQGVNDYWIPGRREAKTSHPIPALSSKDVTVNADLIWRPAYKATSYRVFFGTNPKALTQVSTLTSNIFDPGTLKLNKRYFWRVDSITDSGEIISGDIWHFDTPYVPVTVITDDFESGNLNWQVSGKAHIKNESAFRGNLGLRLMKETTAEKHISSSGYSNIKITYAVKTEKLNSGEQLIVSYSTDGNNWSILEQTTTRDWQKKSFDLPESANNQSQLKLRFTLSGSNASQRAHIDDIKVIGYAIN